MTAATMTLTEFLLARLAEDEAAASPYESAVMAENPTAVFGFGQVTTATQRRALAEVEAKRQLIRLLALQRETTPTANVEYEALLWLALPYADHPNYREEWRA